MAVKSRKIHDGIIKVRKGLYLTEIGLSIVHDEENRCWFIIFRGVNLHRCPTFGDAKFICNIAYKTTEDAEEALAVRQRTSKDHPLVWCVESGWSGGLVHRDLFITEAEARDAYNKIPDKWYKNIYRTRDIWGWLKRQGA